MRVHDQLHSQAEAPAGEVHDEQCTRELHNTAGRVQMLLILLLLLLLLLKSLIITLSI